MNYLYIKALHIIFVTTWFAGLFYLVRLFIYHIEAEDKPEPARQLLKEQYALMSHRLWQIITVPSMWLAVLSGLYLVYTLDYFAAGWMHVKFALVLGLLVYHILCGRIRRQLAKGLVRHTAQQMRIWNEVATLFLFSIVFIVVMKSMLDAFWALVAFVTLALVLFMAIKWYKNYRERQE
jgi:putative membrane protein